MCSISGRDKKTYYLIQLSHLGGIGEGDVSIDINGDGSITVHVAGQPSVTRQVNFYGRSGTKILRGNKIEIQLPKDNSGVKCEHFD